jgi:GntR family transcriptional regulator
MSLSGHHDNVQPQRLVAMGAPSLRRDSAMPFYEQLKQVLLSQIEQGDVQPGDPLPSEFELCAQFGVSRTVVRQAIGELVNEGRLYRMRGKGTFVAKPKLHEQFMESTVGFFEDLTARGHVVESSVMSCELVQPTERVGEALRVAEGEQVIELVRLRSVNDEVVAFTKSYMPVFSTQFFDDLRGADFAKLSLYRYLEERWGIRIESGHRSIEAVLATGMLARLLKIGSGDPVLAIDSIGRDSADRVVEYFQAWHRADRTRLEMDVVRS